MNSLVESTQAAWIVLVPFFISKEHFVEAMATRCRFLATKRESESPAEAGQTACASTPGGEGRRATSFLFTLIRVGGSAMIERPQLPRLSQDARSQTVEKPRAPFTPWFYLWNGSVTGQRWC